jgi:hypothetical protein
MESARFLPFKSVNAFTLPSTSQQECVLGNRRVTTEDMLPKEVERRLTSCPKWLTEKMVGH